MSYPVAPPIWPGDVRRWHATLSLLAQQPTPDARRRVRVRHAQRYGFGVAAAVPLVVWMLTSGYDFDILHGPGLVLWIVGVALMFAGAVLQTGRSHNTPLAPLGRSEREVLRQVVEYHRPIPPGLEGVVREWVLFHRGLRYSWVMAVGWAVIMGTLVAQMSPLPLGVLTAAVGVAFLAYHLRRSVDGYRAERYAVIERALLTPRPFR